MRLLVSRQQELAELEQLLEGARLGRGSFVRILGEPGVGKSRLADALADRALEGGVRGVWVKAWERAAPAPFGLMLELLSALLRVQEEPLLEAALSLLRTRSDVERSERFRAVVNAIAGLGAPVLIVLDDLHAADLDSLELCLHLASALRSSRALIVATQRSVESGAGSEAQQLLEQLARVSPALELRGLDVSGVSELIGGLAGRPPDPAFAEALQRATLGNCLFVDGVVRAALSDGSFERGTIRVPPDLRRAIAARVARAGPELAEVLRTVAALGRPCSLLLLARVTATAEPLLRPLLDAAVDAAFATATEEGTYALRHTLVGDALLASLAPAERARLYADLAQALEQVEGARASAAEVARLFHAAVPVLGAQPALEASARAAEWASQLCAHEQAVRHRRDVLALIDAQGGADPSVRLEAVLGLGEACSRAGRREQARGLLLQAATLAQQGSDAPALGRAALGLAETGEFGKRDLEKIFWLEQAASLLEPRHPAVASQRAWPVLRFRVLSRLAAELWVDASSVPRRQQLASDLVELARSLGDQRSLFRALDGQFQALWGPAGRAARRRVLVELRECLGPDAEEVLACARHGLLAAAEDGDPVAFSRELAVFERAAEPLRRPALDETIAQRRLFLALLRADVRDTERWIVRCRELGDRIQNPQAAMGERFARSFAWVDLGRREPLATLIDGFEQDARRLPNLWFIRARLALLYVYLGRDVEARRELAALVRELSQLPEDLVTLATLASLAEAAWLLDDVPAARALEPRLGPYADHFVSIGSSLPLGSAQRYLGLLAWSLGRPEDALSALERAHRAHEQLQAPAWLARSARELAWLLERAPFQQHARAGELKRELERWGQLEIHPLGAPHERRVPPPSSAQLGARAVLQNSVDAPSDARLERSGQMWQLEFAGHAVHLRDSKGLRLLAVLIGSAGAEHHALELMGGAQLSGQADLGPALDETARGRYRERVGDLRARQQDAEARGDGAAALLARAELEALEEELRRSLGLGGRGRASGAAERARVAVAKALARALEAIAASHPLAAEHLSRSLRTGAFCSYDPDPSRAPPRWRVQG